jgi:hypothetical protein
MWDWIRNREPAGVAAALLLVVTGVTTAVADLPVGTTWPAALGAVLFAVVRALVTPTGKTT